MKARTCLLLMVLGVAILLGACGPSDDVGQAKPPSMIITAPASGQEVQVGHELLIVAAVTDEEGVSRVEVGVDGVLLGTMENPSPAANVPFTVEQSWTAAKLGSHSVMAVAYNVAGVASTPSVVSIEVVAAGEVQPLPSETPASDVATTPTWTPLAVDAQPTPTMPSATEPPSPLPPQATDTVQPPATATTEAQPSGGSEATRPSGPGLITDFEQFGTWKRGDQANGTFTQSSEQAHGGSYSGKLAYSFGSADNDFVIFMQTFFLGGQPNQISVWVYGDGGKHYLNAWVKDAKGETWQFTFGQVKHSGWQQMVAWLDAGAGWPAGHIDGPSNGAIDYPIDFRALVLDDVPDSYAGSGAIFVDDLYSVKGAAAPPAPAPTPGPTAGTATVSYWTEDEEIAQGACTRLHWDVQNVREVYLNNVGVVGQGNRKVCPTTTTTYRLKVIHLDGREEVFPVTIKVQ